MSEHQHAAPSGKPRPPTASTNAYREAATRLQVEMSIPYSGNADKDFAGLMAAYGHGAAALARIELEHGTDPAMRALAEQVVRASEQQGQTVTDWQSQHR